VNISLIIQQKQIWNIASSNIKNQFTKAAQNFDTRNKEKGTTHCVLLHQRTSIAKIKSSTTRYKHILCPNDNSQTNDPRKEHID
jgi:hypothetical protein